MADVKFPNGPAPAAPSAPSAPARRRSRGRAGRVAAFVFCALVYGVLFLPIAVVVANSFNATDAKPYLAWKGFSLVWYERLFQNGPLLASFGHTMELAVATTVISTVLGTLGAVGLYRYTFRGRSIIDGMLYIPVVIPEVVMGISLLLLYVKAQIPRGMAGLVIAHVTFCVSFVIFNVRAALDGYDVALEEASMDLGAGRVETFLRVTLPQLASGIAGGALMSFTLSIDDVVVSYFLYGQYMTFPLQVMQDIRGGVAPDVNALCALVLVATVIFVTLTYGGLGAKLAERWGARRFEAAGRAAAASGAMAAGGDVRSAGATGLEGSAPAGGASCDAEAEAGEEVPREQVR